MEAFIILYPLAIALALVVKFVFWVVTMPIRFVFHLLGGARSRRRPTPPPIQIAPAQDMPQPAPVLPPSSPWPRHRNPHDNPTPWRNP